MRIIYTKYITINGIRYYKKDGGYYRFEVTDEEYYEYMKKHNNC